LSDNDNIYQQNSVTFNNTLYMPLYGLIIVHTLYLDPLGLFSVRLLIL